MPPVLRSTDLNSLIKVPRTFIIILRQKYRYLRRMVLCAVCSASRPPMSSLSSEQMKVFEAMVSQFVNLEPLIKSHTILMCSPCMDQIEMVCKFQTAAVTGIKQLLSFLQEHNQHTSDPNRIMTVSVKQEPYNNLIDVKLEPEDLETRTFQPEPPSLFSVVVKCEPDIDLSNNLGTDNQIKEAEIATEAAKENNTAQRESTPPEPPLFSVVVKCEPDIDLPNDLATENQINETEIATEAGEAEFDNETNMGTFTDKPAKVLTNGNTDVATASTSKFALRTQINSTTSALLKCNIYDPKFLNKYFSESRDGCQPETSVNNETNVAKSTENFVTMPNGQVSDGASSAASPCVPLPNASGSLSASATTSQLNSQKQKNYRTKQIVDCGICGATFLSKRFMEIHSRTKHGLKKPSVNLFCGACCVTSRTVAAHRQHIASAHNELKFQCDECTRKFPTEGRLAEHKEHMHHNKSRSISERARRHRCDVCGAAFVFRSALYAHGKLMHGQPAQRRGNSNGKKGNAAKKDKAGKKGNDGEKRG